jgi:GntR family transcriptional repressor for pyruvate dehydrogenase complex
VAWWSDKLIDRGETWPPCQAIKFAADATLVREAGRLTPAQERGDSERLRGAPIFVPVQSTSLPSQIRSRLEQAIASGALTPGEALPSERSLAEQFAVSRAVVREALRALEATGLVDVRSGSGAFVSRSGGDALRDNWTSWLRSNQDEVFELISVRRALEQLAASRAAERATVRDVRELRRVCTSFEYELRQGEPDQARLAELDVEFHQRIARIGGGTVIPRLVDEVAAVVGNSRRITFAQPGPSRAVAADHRRIVEAIARHDAVRAAEALAAHMTTIERTLVEFHEARVLDVGREAVDRLLGERES